MERSLLEQNFRIFWDILKACRNNPVCLTGQACPDHFNMFIHLLSRILPPTRSVLTSWLLEKLLAAGTCICQSPLDVSSEAQKDVFILRRKPYLGIIRLGFGLAELG